LARNGATHHSFTPVELLARIAALITPPRHPFLRYHGAVAPASRWRKDIVLRIGPLVRRVARCDDCVQARWTRRRLARDARIGVTLAEGVATTPNAAPGTSIKRFGS
jgi:hypothetical protein